jgi:hypothetical protein
MLCALSLLLFAVGASIAIMLCKLLPCSCNGGGMYVPALLVGKAHCRPLQKGHCGGAWKRRSSIITTAYLRNEDILTAVEENLAYLNPPVLSVFKDFVSRIKLVDPDVDGGSP